MRDVFQQDPFRNAAYSEHHEGENTAIVDHVHNSIRYQTGHSERLYAIAHRYRLGHYYREPAVRLAVSGGCQKDVLANLQSPKICMKRESVRKQKRS